MTPAVIRGELPLRIVDQPGGAVIRCLCGRELAQIRRGVTSEHFARQAREGHRLPHLAPDISARGLAVMVAHALQCDQRSVGAAC